MPSNNKTNEDNNCKEKLGAASFSIYVNIFLTIIKLGVAILTNSLAIIAELMHSLFDLLASVFAYFGIKKAAEPADEKHQFGHEKIENISSLLQTLLIVVTSAIIIYESIHRLIEPKPINAGLIGLTVMALTIIIDFFISRYLHKASDNYGSVALEADAYHFTTDLWCAIAVVIGLFFVYLGFPIFDSIAAIIVALLMLWISYKLGEKAIHSLIDGTPPNFIIEKMAKIIASTKGVRTFHKLKARNAGSMTLIEVHIWVNPNLTLKAAHKIAHDVKKRLIKAIPTIKDATIHVEPYNPKIEKS